MESSASTPSPFEQAAIPLGLDFAALVYRSRPARLARRLEERLKQAAKYGARHLNVPRTRVLEALARVGRFPHWHALHAHLNQLGEDRDTPDGWFTALGSLLPLLVDIPPGLSPEAEPRQALEAWGGRLAAELGHPFDQVMDQVMAPLWGERRWAELCSRSPFDVREPLYDFHLNAGSGEGRFVLSAAGVALDDQLQAQLESYVGASRLRQREVRRWVEACFARRPDFLDAGLALAEIMQQAGEATALPLLDQLIQAAEALMPPGYRGRVCWGFQDNRCYLRLVWARLWELFLQGRDRQALAAARKLLRRNPRDNQGIRYLLPLLCLVCGEVPGAQRAIQRVKQEEGRVVAATRALVAFAGGDQRTFRRELLQALFTFPLLRCYVMDDPGALPDGDTGVRGVREDLETWYAFAKPALHTVPGLAKAVRALLQDKAVRAAEAHLRRIWCTPSEPGSTLRMHLYQEWQSTLNQYVATLTG